uniref:Leualacin synthetase n=1 Tax=Hapsidospora irregularis TaxID=95324 RepID=A0A1I9VZ84_HAPIR|nr:leualacin synthetase [Hapsidospora irregularis]
MYDNGHHTEAADYWRDALADCECDPFPRVPSSAPPPSPDSIIEHRSPILEQRDSGVAISTTIYAAWALLVSRMADSDDVVFGIAALERSAENNANTAVAPLRIPVAWDQTIVNYLDTVQRQERDLATFAAAGLSDIAQTCPGAQRACDFQTLFLVRTQQGRQAGQVQSVAPSGARCHALVIDLEPSANQAVMNVRFDSTVISHATVERWLERLDLVILGLWSSDPHKTISTITMIGERDLKDIWDWNTPVPAPADRCVHELVEAQAQAHPSKPAICAWDGDLTYGELNRLSELLAAHLGERGVGPNTLVPLCFEKSMYTAVAMLGVLKAGGGFVLLDPSLPEQRLQAMVQQARSKFILASTSTRHLCSRLAPEVDTINAQFFADRNHEPPRSSGPTRPDSVMYVVYTSGSSGVPKGVIITHQNHATALLHQTGMEGLGPESRIYDFSAYSFDITIYNTFAALTLGGCLCVPSERQRRNELAQSMTSLAATFAYLTPTVARQLSPDETPTLETLVLSGEALHARDVDPWWGRIRVINAYGPSECTTASTVHPDPSTPADATGIGKGAGLVTWIVDPEDHNILLPPGCVGELLLEGPVVGRGYLDNAEQTSASFIQAPMWLQKGGSGHNGRSGILYKTGDLVEYTDAGNIKFIGRKDTQVKIRGHRVELGEVEHAVHGCMAGFKQAVAETVATGRSGSSLSTLVAFLEADQPLENAGEAELAPKTLPVPSEVKGKLLRVLPSYMIPTLFIELPRLPTTHTGKIHRKQLRAIAEPLLSRHLGRILSSERPKRQPVLDVEQKMQQVWSCVLEIERQMVGLDDSFFDLGGDSLGAMKVVSEARKMELVITVADVFQYLTLQNVSAQAKDMSTHSPEAVLPFSLLEGEGGLKAQSFIRDVSIRYGLDPSSLKDAYPCTPLQKGLLSLSAKSPGDYVMQGVLELSDKLDLDAFRDAWEAVCRKIEILRTRIVQHDQHGLLQLVLDEPISWVEAAGLDSYLNADRKNAMDIGQPLARYSMVKDEGGSTRWFVWTVHHALFDAWSLSLILDTVNHTYEGKPAQPTPPFKTFIKYIKDQSFERMADYWIQALAECECPVFPSLPPSVERPVTDSVMEHPLHHPRQHLHSSITPSTMVRAAWSLIMSNITNSDDVVFGATVSGRSAPVPGVESVPAPTIATVPVRVRLAKHQQVSDFLHSVQRQSADMIPFEQMGLHRIAKLGPDAQQAVSFQTLLVIQPIDNSETQSVLGLWSLGNQQQSVNTYGLILEIQLGKGEMTARASYDSRLIQPWLVQRLLERLDLAMRQLDGADPEEPLSEFNIVTCKDLEQIWSWNRHVPTVSQLCIPQVLETQAVSHPNRPAVCAWDGDLTYAELDCLATGLALQLVEREVGKEDIVPLYFEKSMWTTVAMFGVLRAGAAFVLLDPSLPQKRLEEIMRQTKATMVVSSLSNEDESSSLSRQVLILGPHSVQALQERARGQASQRLASSTPSSPAYVIFTSGSTGNPKGVVVTHGNVTSAVPEHVRSFGYTEDSRIYDFASYSFGAALNNAFVALMSGGCLCVPSEDDRRSNMPGSITSLRATAVLLTPSVAESLSPDQVPTLKTIIYGGEAVHLKDVSPWWGKTQVLTAYGSSEVTTVATVNTQATTMQEVPQIGTGSGGVTWVVDPENHQKLLPPGCVGELVLEGPLVGIGYLGDTQKTSEVFIEDPRWLLDGFQGYPGRHGRLYKTGDLVRYNENGNLTYVGRKDAQVKIRGQRVELGEVEFRVQECFPEATQVVAEVVVPRGKTSSPTLAAFLLLSDTTASNGTSKLDEATALPVAAAVEERLSKHLPSYMVPTLFFAMQALPMTATGKMNRRRLREIGSTITTQELADLRTNPKWEKRQPTTKLERSLHAIWAQVLNIDSSRIGVDDSFFQLGGDSISAMQVATTARSSFINIGVADILRQKTIYNLAKTAQEIKEAPDMQAKYSQSLAKSSGSTPQLSPIQRLYFHLQHDPTACFDQFFYLGLRSEVDVEVLCAALEMLVRRHAVLRARFARNQKGTWEVRIAPDVSSSLLFRLENSEEPDFAAAIAQSREALDIVKGPIFSAVLFNTPVRQSLFLTIHHLVIDLVSWRVLIQELETVLKQGTLASPHSLGFSTWTSAQAQYARQNLEPDTSSWRQDKILLGYWGMQSNPNVKGGAIVRDFALDEVVSSLILGDCNDALGTRPVELMIAALAYSFRGVFSDRHLPLVYSEGHGREPWDERLDITSTVGWFSTIFPVELNPGLDATLIEFVRRTKDCMRSLSHNGWSDFTSRFAGEGEADRFAKEFPVEVMFNYAGLYQNLEREDGLFEQLTTPGGCDPPSSFEVRRFSLFDFDVSVIRGRITGSVEFHRDMRHGEKILEWIGEYQRTLEQMAKLLPTCPYTWTLNDFPLAFESYRDIDEFRDTTLSRLGVQPGDIEDIFPCAPLQEGILLAQAKESANYQRWSDIEISLNGDGPQLEKSRLTQAWEAVVKRHALLRAVLVESFPGSSRTMHVVLKDPEPSISWDMSTKPSQSRSFDKYGLQHHVHVYEADERRARLRFYSNHVIIDGFSQGLLCSNLQSAYNNSLQSAISSYKDFVLYLEDLPHADGLSFWSRYLSGVDPCHFPTSPAAILDCASKNPVPVPRLDVDGIRAFSAKWDVTPATIIKVAWGLVLGIYTGTTTPCFGNLCSGRDVPVDNIDNVFGPVVGTVPCRIRLQNGKGVLDTLREAQADYLDTIPFQHFPLTDIHRAAGVGSSPLFNTLLSYQKVGEELSAVKHGLAVRAVGNHDPTEVCHGKELRNKHTNASQYDITVDIEDTGAQMTISLDFRPQCLSTTDAARLANSLSVAISEIVANPDQVIEDVPLMTEDDLRLIWQWNHTVPEAPGRFVHDLVHEQALTAPDAPAVCAWDGQLSYKQLDELSTGLAGRLIQLGVMGGGPIPLCFEKSQWTSVAMLAVLKTGAAFVLLDSSLPYQRLQSIVQQVKSDLILSSSANMDLSASLCRTVLQVSADTAGSSDAITIPKLLSGPELTTMFAVFTSGSTGTPKGVLIAHANFTCALEHQSEALGFTDTSRVFDFASYAFDAAVHNTFATFITGGCLCVPSEHDRKSDTEAIMRTMRVTVADLTPSVARVLDPRSLPDLKTLIMGGEALSVDDVNRWWGRVRIVNAYGPAETTPIATINADAPTPEKSTLLGKGSGQVTWVVDPQNRNRLMPPGSVGELVLEGQPVGQGYLNDPERTAASFIEDPPWLVQGAPGHSGRRGRVYMTGDLVRYEDDGSMAYVTRKDAQVKIRGQRVELGEVERRVQECIPEASQVIAEMIKPQGEDRNPMLAVFLQTGNNMKAGRVEESTKVEIFGITEEIRLKLSARLPRYMIPAVFFSIQRLPKTPSGKTYRIQLRQIGASFSVRQLAEMRPGGRDQARQPTSEREKKLQQVWSRVLDVEASAIGLDDDFFQLGGDSIAAMKLASEARKAGISVSVADIFRHPTLFGVAQQGGDGAANGALADIAPFGLLNNDLDTGVFLEDAASQCHLESPTAILDAYPCTPLQEGLLSLSMKRPGAYTLQATLRLDPSVDIQAFCKAWEKVVHSFPVLRTRIIEHHELGLLQVVVDEKIRWVHASSLEAYLLADRQQPMTLGSPLGRYALISNASDGQRCFVWTVHHALYDGWSEGLIIKAVNQAYDGAGFQGGAPFSAFIKHIRDTDNNAMVDYWKHILDGNQAVPFPAIPPTFGEPVADKSVEASLPRPLNQARNVTTSTLIRAAWALVAGRRSGHDDVVFGVTVSGRNAPVPGIDMMVGPTFATVPLRVQLLAGQSVADYLKAVQYRSAEMIPFEQMGLHNIAKVSTSTRQACAFQTLLVIQPQASEAENVLGCWQDGDQSQWFNSYGLTLDVNVGTTDIVVRATFDSRVIEPWVVQKLLQQLGHVMHQLDDNASTDRAVRDITTVTPQDLEQLWAWNKTVPPPADRCAHELIRDRVREQPHAPAVSAWDGELTYQELDDLSTNMSGRLVDLGVKPGTFVPLCFEKSIWATVAMLAVVKTAAAFVLLDPSLPKQQLKSIIQQVDARMIVSSPSNMALSTQVCHEVVVMGPEFIAEIRDRTPGTLLPTPSLDSIVYVVFTFGTTGTPKGVVINHRNSASAVLHQVEGFGYNRATRLYDFSTYSSDGCILNAFTVLVAGGCLCIPTDHGRKSTLAESMESFKANAVFLTPSIAQLLSPEQVPHMRSMILGGEAIRLKHVQPWWDSETCKVFTIYGPSECTPVSMINHSPATPEEALRLGWGAGQVPWIVDPEDHDSLVPLGSIGELLLEGPLVGPGYLNESEKTTASFIRDPAWLLKGAPGRHPGRHARLYKTGDLAQFNEDGSVSYVSRKDDQVKLHGQRIVLGEVEHHAHPCFPSAAQIVAEVIVPQGKNTAPTLAAFLQLGEEEMAAVSVHVEGTPESVKVLRAPEDALQKLSQTLPGYMVPTVFFAMRQLPLSATGKMDRKKLREIGSSFSIADLALACTATESPKRQPESDIEKQMQGIWARVLDIEPSMIGLDDSFFRLGGDSITAMKLVGEARRAGLQLVVADVLRRPRLQEVALASRSSGVINDMIPRARSEGPVEQSFAQGRLWFLEQLYPGLTWYLVPCAMRLRGPLDLKALNAAFSALESRHETLRTTFDSHDGRDVQQVLPFQEKPLNVIDVADEEALTRELDKVQKSPFDLRREPGWRVTLFKLDNENHLLSIIMHHIISDGWSVDILRKELSTFYAAAAKNPDQDPLSQVEPLPIQYRDFSVWQRGQQQIEEHQRQLAYWVKELETSQPAELLCDKPRPSTLSGAAATESIRVEGSLYEQLQSFCTTHSVTPFVALLATFRATHFFLTGSEDATMGTANANRDRWEVKDMVGFFVNMQCIRIKVGDESFEQLVRQVHATTVASFANQDVPFENIVSQLQRDRDLSRHPLAQVAFALHSQMDLGDFALQDLDAETVDVPPTTRFDIEFHFAQERQALEGLVLYSTDLFEAETIRNMLSVFQSVLATGLANPTTAIKTMSIFSNKHFAELDGLGLIKVDDVPYPRDSSIVDLFRQQVPLCPGRIAVKDSTSQLTYAQLDHQSDMLARWLSRRAFAPETPVGVFSPRCCETVVAFLGVLKANLAYLPLDVKIPQGRMDTILSSVEGHKIVLFGPDVHPPSIQREDVEFVAIAEALRDRTSEDRTLTGPSATSLAYVMFTSGSTGRPKGVMVNHRGLVRVVKGSNNMASYLPAGPTVALITNPAFDPSIWEICGTILNGGTLICISAEAVLDYRVVSDTFIREGVRAATFTPALLKQYLSECPDAIAGLDTIYVGGERADADDLFLAKGLTKGPVINAYGPTENSVVSTLYSLQDGEKCVNGVPIGRAISNSGAYVMDTQQRLVPLGVIGELVVTGDGLARGYTEPERNVDRFVTVRIGTRSVQAYRTGDSVRYRPKDGQLEFFGRIDGQVKVRGHRIELAEIEHSLRSHGAVDDAVVVLQQQQESGDARLAGFITIKDATLEGAEPDDADAAEVVNVWGEVFDANTYSAISDVRPEDIGRDFTGWVSMYNGEEIDKAEMNEWLDDSISTMLNGGEARDILELGTGSGMILFNLTQRGLNSYIGLDPSSRAVDFIAKTARSIPSLQDKVRVYLGTADNLGRVPSSVSPNLVVVNSVAQYFPSQEYLLKVVEDVVRMDSVETLFFGDMRSYPLSRQFQAHKAVYTSGEAASKDEVRREMERIEKEDTELQVDPAFFTALAARLPERVAHVEILPKRMKVTNELSAFRYAAVVHLKGPDSPGPQVHSVDKGEWINFRNDQLDGESLSQLLRSALDADIVAVSNIPYRKTIVERHILEALDQGPESRNWIASARRQADNCPSLSAVDLVEIGESHGFRVEVSWARQYSQRGDLDAVFHRLRPAQGQERTMFRFSTDHHNRPVHSFSSRPLQLKRNQKVKKDLYERLQQQLPAYMVPQVITTLDKMPINANGKIDRQALSARVNSSTAAPRASSVQQPRTDAEREMQRIWAHVLSIGASTIGVEDSFFHLGGSSLSAMKVVSETRKAGLEITVADVFRHDVLGELARHSSVRTEGEAEDTEAPVLVDPAKKAALLEEIGSVGLDVGTGIEDVLPLTSFQERIVLNGEKIRQHANYFYIELGSDLKVSQMEESFTMTLDKFPILRSCFPRLQGQLWRVVLRQLRLPIHVEDVRDDDDLGQASDAFCLADAKTLSSDGIPVSLTLLRHGTQGVRLVLRISHTQYDGVSLPVILQSLMDGYHGIQTNPGPEFTRLLAHASRKRDKSIAYWTEVLRGSTLTVPEAVLRPEITPGSSAERIDEEAEIDVPKLPGRTTEASLLSAAWALLLSRITGEADVVFGHVVAGRNSAIPGIAEMVGPCINIMPLRASLAPDTTPRQLLLSLQEQFVSVGDADSLGFKDIIEHCTDWPAGSTFESMIQHQNIDEHPEIESTETPARLQFLGEDHVVPQSLQMISYPQEGGRRLRIRLVGNTHILTREMAGSMMRAICTIAGAVGDDLDGSLGGIMPGVVDL